MRNDPIMLTPGTLRVSPRVMQASMHQLQHRSPLVEQAFARIRERIFTLFDLKPSHSLTLFPTTGRGGLEAALSAIVQEHPTVFIVNGRWSQFMWKIAAASRCDTSHIQKFEYSFMKPLDVNQVQKDLEQFGRNVRFVCFTSHETETGILNPTDQLLALCREKQWFSFVDAMSSVVIDPAKVHEANVFCFNACKGVRSLRDIACVVTNEFVPDDIFADVGAYLNFRNEIVAQRSQATPLNPFPVGPVLAFAEALRELEEDGVGVRRRKIMQTMSLLHSWVKLVGLEVLTDWKYLGWATIPLRLPSPWSYKEFRRALLPRGFDVYYSTEGPNGNTFELSTLGWLSELDVLEFMDTANEILGFKS